MGFASILGPLAALAAGILLGRGMDRIAGVCLLISVVTPTYFAYPLNVMALGVGVALVVFPRWLLTGRTHNGAAHV